MCESKVITLENVCLEPITPVVAKKGEALLLNIGTKQGYTEVYRRVLDKDFTCDSVSVVKFKDILGRKAGYVAIFAGNEDE